MSLIALRLLEEVWLQTEEQSSTNAFPVSQKGLVVRAKGATSSVAREILIKASLRGRADSHYGKGIPGIRGVSTHTAREERNLASRRFLLSSKTYLSASIKRQLFFAIDRSAGGIDFQLEEGDTT